MTLEEKIDVTERNVARGLQGQADLDALRECGRVKPPVIRPTISHELAALAAFDAEPPAGAVRPAAGTEPLALLLKFVKDFYDEPMLKNDLDSVLSLCATDADRREVKKFARAKLTGKPYEGPVSLDPKTCESCGSPFVPRRDDARFCSPACRVRANRRNALPLLRISPFRACV